MTAFLQSFAGFAALAAIAALIGQRTRLPSGLAPLDRDQTILRGW